MIITPNISYVYFYAFLYYFHRIVFQLVLLHLQNPNIIRKHMNQAFDEKCQKKPPKFNFSHAKFRKTYLYHMTQRKEKCKIIANTRVEKVKCIFTEKVQQEFNVIYIIPQKSDIGSFYFQLKNLLTLKRGQELSLKSSWPPTNKNKWKKKILGSIHSAS